MKLASVLCVVVLAAACHAHERLRTVAVTRHALCASMRSCARCLRLPQCAWCDSNCFPVLLRERVQCADTLITHLDRGLSHARNAECACARGKLLPEDCTAPGAEAECSGRGSCSCGRCVCDTAKELNKMVTGKYCECDNFSCEKLAGGACSEPEVPYCHPPNTTIPS